MNMQFYLSPKKVEIKRTTYGLFNIVTDIGGLIKIVEAIANILITPVSRYLYFLVLIRKLFLVGTDDKNNILNENMDGSHKS